MVKMRRKEGTRTGQGEETNNLVNVRRNKGAITSQLSEENKKLVKVRRNKGTRTGQGVKNREPSQGEEKRGSRSGQGEENKNLVKSFLQLHDQCEMNYLR